MGIARRALKRARDWAKDFRERGREAALERRKGKANEILTGARHMIDTLEATGDKYSTAGFLPVNRLGEQLKNLEIREFRGEDVYAEARALHKEISVHYNGLRGILKRGR